MPLTVFDLLMRGYFPKELPPPFSTAAFAQAVAGIGATPDPAFRAVTVLGNKGEQIGNATPVESELCTHNLVRSGRLRRTLGIPNPVHFSRLSDLVVSSWTNLQSVANLSQYSRTKPTESPVGRAIGPAHQLSDRPNDRAQLRSSARFVVRTDISRFFPSIYTHTIPWAVRGKASAKTAFRARKLRGDWDDSLDAACRAVNSQQTVGIPIGPDTSRVVAEAILGRVDSELTSSYPKLKGFRYIDDYEFGATTRSQAEEVVGHFQKVLADFELAINISKTSILELPESLEAEWASVLRRFQFRRTTAMAQRTDLSGYFDLAIGFAKRYPDQDVVKYAISRLRTETVEEEIWEFFEHLLNHFVLVEPACIQQVCDQVVYYMSQGYPMDARLWQTTLNEVICERLPMGHASECAWAMWLMRIIGCRLLVRTEKVVASTEDSVVALMALGLVTTRQASGGHLSPLLQFAGPAALYQRQWLLCYQGHRLGWPGLKHSSSVAASSSFASLDSAGVDFFSMAVQHPTPIRGNTGGFGGGGGDSE